MQSWSISVLTSLTMLLAGCADDPAPMDAGRDAGRDAGIPEGGFPREDVGIPELDAGPPDAGAPDTGPPDAGDPDTGTFDAGFDASFDASLPDTGPEGGFPRPDALVDTGPLPDVFVPDTGPPDAGPPVVRVFDDRDEWAAAADCAPITELYFDGPTEVNLRFVDDARIIPSYSSLGLDFQPFIDTTIMPQILRGRDPDIVVPGHDALVTNRPSPAPRTDLLGRAINATFNRVTRTVGVWCNLRDGGYIEAFDATGAPLGRASISSGGFGGITSSVPIDSIRLVNTFDGDIVWGIYGLQYSACSGE
jgi:hypothetical protein